MMYACVFESCCVFFAAVLCNLSTSGASKAYDNENRVEDEKYFISILLELQLSSKMQLLLLCIQVDSLLRKKTTRKTWHPHSILFNNCMLAFPKYLSCWVHRHFYPVSFWFHWETMFLMPVSLLYKLSWCNVYFIWRLEVSFLHSICCFFHVWTGCCIWTNFFRTRQWAFIRLLDGWPFLAF